MNQARQNRNSKQPLNLLTLVSAIAIGLSFAAVPVIGSSQETVVTESDFEEEKVYSPYADRAYADNIYFGDTHFHTELSFDAGLVGTSLGGH